VQLRHQEQVQIAVGEADHSAHVSAERRVASANVSAHAAKIAAESAERHAMVMADAADLAAAASSAMLTEDPSTGRSAWDPNRPVLVETQAIRS
jgi:hypothetical protein